MSWSHHPGVRSGSDLTFGERSADAMRNSFGTWTFLGLFVLIMAVWIATGGFGTDASPYFRLNLALSCLAGLQGAIILLAAKRADRVASEAATHHYEEGRQTEALLEANTKLTEQVHELTKLVHERVCTR